MINRFNTYINHIEPDFWRDLCVNEGELRCYRSGDEFITVGEVAPYIGYIKSGTLKYVVYSEDGTEHVVGMEFEGEFVADFPFSLSGREARVSIIAVSTCYIHCFPVKDIVRMMDESEKVKEVVNKSTEAIFSTVYDRYMAIYSKTPRERYEELLTHNPEMLSLFSLRDIASFLNITPTHLSRLRKKK